MDHKEKHHLRLHILASLFFAVMALYLGVLYDTQITNYEYYHARSIRDITRSEPVEAARGDLTDRNGEVLVSSRPSYDLTFDASLLREDQDAGEAVLRLLELCRDQGITWEDDLPITRTAPLSYHAGRPGRRGQKPLPHLPAGIWMRRRTPWGRTFWTTPPCWRPWTRTGRGRTPPTTSWRTSGLDTDAKKAAALLEELTLAAS